MFRHHLLTIVAVVAATLGLGTAAAGLAAARGAGSVLFVGKGANSSSHSMRGCNAPDFATISDAVAAAQPGNTVIVCPGTYSEDVLVNKSLRLVGLSATIDATGLENAIQVVTSHVSITGFTVQNANGEGILVGVDTAADAGLLTSRVLTGVHIDHVVAAVDDRGFNGTETPNCKYPGDCGGGIHLNVTRWSSVRNSIVLGNADGILITDDYGPTSHNLIARNLVTDNTTECGIVLAGHNPQAVNFDPNTFVVTGRNPNLGGIYDNVIVNNVSLRNGTAPAPPSFGGGGSGSGIGLYGSGPGTAVYNTLVEHNVASGNGLAGFNIHAHLPGGEDLNGNKVIDNRFGTNNTGGDPFDGPPGPTDMQTTGIAIYSAPHIHMVVRGNSISNNQIGIWASNTVTAHGLHDNAFHHVQQHIVRG
jgi:hypothetical protein